MHKILHIITKINVNNITEGREYVEDMWKDRAYEKTLI